MTKDEWNEVMGNTKLAASRQQEAEILRRFREQGYEMTNLHQDAKMRSYYVDTHRDVSFGVGDIRIHSHSFYEYICVQCVGNMEYMIGTSCFQIQRGDILVIPPNTPHCPMLSKDMSVPYDRDVLWVSMELIQVMSRQMEHPYAAQGRPVLLRTMGTQWEHLPKMFRDGVREATQCRPHWENYVLGNTLMLLAEMWRFWENQMPSSHADREPQLMERAVSYIDAHYGQKITLKDIAAHCMVSESTICHAFRERMGTSFSQCLIQRRLIASKELILTDKPLEEVGKAVGFSDYSTFYRAFRREYGVSPRQFKALAQDGRGEIRNPK